MINNFLNKYKKIIATTIVTLALFIALSYVSETINIIGGVVLGTLIGTAISCIPVIIAFGIFWAVAKVFNLKVDFSNYSEDLDKPITKRQLHEYILLFLFLAFLFKNSN